MICQSFWLTGCDGAEGRRWTEQLVFCPSSSAPVRFWRRDSWQLHVPPESSASRTGQECLDDPALKEKQKSAAEGQRLWLKVSACREAFHPVRSKQKYLASDLHCWVNWSLFRHFSSSVHADVEFSHPVQRLVKRSLRQWQSFVIPEWHLKVLVTFRSFRDCVPRWTCFLSRSNVSAG